MDHLIPVISVFISLYGYPAIFIAAMFEGEIVMLLGGLAVHQGYLSIVPLFVLAFAGAFSSDIIWFSLGRWKGQKLLDRFAWLKKFTSGPLKFIHSNPISLSFSMRFLYGFRNLVPFSLGMSNIPLKKFAFYDALGALAWVLITGVTGYLFGGILELFIGRIKRYEFVIIIVAVTIFLGASVLSRFSKYFAEKFFSDNNVSENNKHLD